MSKKNKKPKIEVNFKEGLNEEQAKVFETLDEFTKDISGNMFCVKGYAGVGKTFVITQFIKHYINSNKGKKVVLSAPTNKAVQVLKESSSKELKSSPFISFNTIHQVLGVKPTINEDGEQLFIAQKDKKIDHINILVIDEVSMLSDDLFYELIKHKNKVKIIFMGDPAQIPPVNKVDCEPFLNPEKYNIVNASMTKIMRQSDGSALVDLSFQIRDNLTTWNPYKIETESGFDLLVFKNNTLEAKEQLKKTLTEFYSSDEFKSNTQNYKIIAWRNERVAFYNKFIREIYHGNSELPEYMVGDLIITNKPIFENGEIIINNNQELIISEVEQMKFDIRKKKIDGYRVKVVYFDVDAEREISKEIKIISDLGLLDFSKILKSLSKAALGSFDAKQKKQLWKQYYDTKQLFADVSYSFCITAHKSQGSTYKKTFVDMNDICANQNVIERNRIAYTAITRAKSFCTIITS